MPHRLAAVALLFLVVGCASDDERAAAAAAANTCQQRFPEGGAQMEACRVQMEANIRDARNYHRETERAQGKGKGKR